MFLFISSFPPVSMQKSKYMLTNFNLCGIMFINIGYFLDIDDATKTNIFGGNYAGRAKTVRNS